MAKRLLCAFVGPNRWSSSGGRVIDPGRHNAITQRANDLYAAAKKKKGFKFDPNESRIPVSGLAEHCDMSMPTVDAVIQLKKYGKPRSDAQQLMVGMTDPRAIKMMNGVIDWVWSVGIPPDQWQMHIPSAESTPRV